MRAPTAVHRLLAMLCAVAATATGCGFQGLNSLPLPGAPGRGPGATIYHVEMMNVATLESNSPVMVNNVVIGSVGKMTVRNRHADVEISIKPGVMIPANAVASIGQTSLLGSMHLSLNPPLGQPTSGKLLPGATIPLNRTSTYPTTERTLSSLAVVVNGGGLGQLGDIIHNASTALSGHETDLRDLLIRLNDFLAVFDGQRDSIVASIQSLNQFAGTFAGHTDVLDRALRDLPPALSVLIKERPRITTALQKLGQFGDTATRLCNDSEADLVKNLQNLEPALRALADVGPDLDRAINAATVYPFTQNIIDRGLRGDYLNLFVVLDMTVARLKRTLLLGTRWGEEGAKLVPAPGEPWYLNYTYEPLSAPITGAPQAPPADSPAAAALSDLNRQLVLGGAQAPQSQPPGIAPWDTGGR